MPSGELLRLLIIRTVNIYWVLTMFHLKPQLHPAKEIQYLVYRRGGDITCPRSQNWEESRLECRQFDSRD